MEVKPFRYSYRTYLDNPQHVKINQILQNLDKINYKSKNKFISDAIEYYIDHLQHMQVHIHPSRAITQF